MPHTQIAAVRAARRAAKKVPSWANYADYQLELDKLLFIARDPRTSVEHRALCQVELRIGVREDRGEETP